MGVRQGVIRLGLALLIRFYNAIFHNSIFFSAIKLKLKYSKLKNLFNDFGNWFFKLAVFPTNTLFYLETRLIIDSRNGTTVFAFLMMQESLFSWKTCALQQDLNDSIQLLRLESISLFFRNIFPCLFMNIFSLYSRCDNKYCTRQDLFRLVCFDNMLKKHFQKRPTAMLNFMESKVVLQQSSHFWMAFLEVFKQRNKVQTYAKRCAIFTFHTDLFFV